MCGIFKAGSDRRDAIDFAGDPTQAFGDLVFAPAFGQELHAHTDAEEWPALLPNRFVQRRRHAVDRVEPAAAIRKGADAGQHDAIGARHHGRIVRHDDRLAEI